MSEGPENLLDENDKKALQYLEEVTINADETQLRVLTEILSNNAHVEYLQSHGLNGCTDAATFKKVIPVISYEALEPYIDRIAKGDSSPILCSNPIIEFLISTGTSGGQYKLLPATEDEFQRRMYNLSLLWPTVKLAFPDSNEGKELYFIFAYHEGKTAGGIVARPFSTSLLKRGLLNSPSNISPNEVFLCLDSKQALYCHLLFAFYQNQQVFQLGSTFSSTLLHVIKFLEKHWVLLVNDIRTGTINPIITDPSLKKCCLSILKPDPELADFLESECSKETWEGIITRLWPNTKYMDAIVTGSMSQYIPALNYYSNGLPLVSSVYAASECLMGLNLNPSSKPEDISYTIIPTAAYFEFLPVDMRNGSYKCADDRELVDLVHVKLGQEYELVVTTYSGLYRYCMGDILRVTGFKNKAPQFSFVCRKNVALSIGLEKTDESELHKAVKKADGLLTPFEAALIDYTSYGDRSSNPGHYVLYWEMKVKEERRVPSYVYEECCVAVEESLGLDYCYERVETKGIGPLEIKIVEEGTFEELMVVAVSRGSSVSQYKTPRCVKDAQTVELLNSRVVSNFYSPKYPKWDPTQLHPLVS